MLNLSKRIFGMAVLTGLTACGTVPDKTNEAAVETKPLASLIPPNLTKEQRADILETARALSDRNAKSALELFTLATITEITAKSGTITREVCHEISDPKILNMPKGISQDFRDSVELESALEGKGVDAAHMSRRVGAMEAIVEQINQSLAITVAECARKFGN